MAMDSAPVVPRGDTANSVNTPVELLTLKIDVEAEPALFTNRNAPEGCSAIRSALSAVGCCVNGLPGTAASVGVTPSTRRKAHTWLFTASGRYTNWPSRETTTEREREFA